MPSGTQMSYHDNPNTRHSSKFVSAYLPNCNDGRELLKRLKFAFMRGLTFTVGTSATSGQTNQITWWVLFIYLKLRTVVKSDQICYISGLLFITKQHLRVEYMGIQTQTILQTVMESWMGSMSLLLKISTTTERRHLAETLSADNLKLGIKWTSITYFILHSKYCTWGNKIEAECYQTAYVDLPSQISTKSWTELESFQRFCAVSFL